MHLINKTVVILLACVSLIPPAQCGGGQTADTATPEMARQHIDQGEEYLAGKLYDEAIEEYTAAIALDSTLADAYLGRGKAYHFGKELYSRAADDFSRALELDPKNGAAWYYRGLAGMDNGAYDRALADFSAAVELEPDLAMPRYLRAWCTTFIAQWDISSQQRLYQLFSSDAGLSLAYRGDGWNYVKQMQWDLAAVPDSITSTLPAPAQEKSIPLSITPLEPDTALGKYPSTPYIKMQPLTGPAGTKLNIYGWGFRANEDGITVTWDGEIITVNIRAETDGSVIIDGSSVPPGSPIHDGTTRAVIYVPPSTQGTHILGVYGSSFTPKGTVKGLSLIHI